MRKAYKGIPKSNWMHSLQSNLFVVWASAARSIWIRPPSIFLPSPSEVVLPGGVFLFWSALTCLSVSVVAGQNSMFLWNFVSWRGKRQLEQLSCFNQPIRMMQWATHKFMSGSDTLRMVTCYLNTNLISGNHQAPKWGRGGTHYKNSQTHLGRLAKQPTNLLIYLVCPGASANESWVRNCKWHKLQQILCYTCSPKIRSSCKWMHCRNRKNSWKLIQIYLQWLSLVTKAGSIATTQ